MAGDTRDTSVVLVTRPEPAASRLARRLCDLGWDAHTASPFALAGPGDRELARSRLQAVLPVDVAIFTSAEAVSRTVDLVGTEPFSACRILVPGAGTAGAARAAGLPHARFPSSGGTSEDLLALPELAEPSGLKILILAAAGGRRLLERTLSAREAEVHRVHVYRRVAVPVPETLVKLLSRDAGIITLATSAAALMGLMRELPDPSRRRVLSGVLVVSSRRLARHCRRLGAKHVIESAGAADDAMISALESLLRNL